MNAARLQAHHALQWLARFARAYVPPQPDDGHTSLAWDGNVDEFSTHASMDGTRLGLQVTGLTLALYEGDRAAPIQSLSLHGRSEAETHRWLDECLAALGLDGQALDAASPYEIPAHAVASGGAYDAAGSADGLAELAGWFADASLLLGRVHGAMIQQMRAASAVRCWPHHFDLATLITLPARGGGEPGYVGAGLSPGDEYYDEPYFYVSVYPEPAKATLPALPPLGHWHTHEFIAAVATASEIVAAKDQEAGAEEFLRGAVGAALKILS